MSTAIQSPSLDAHMRAAQRFPLLTRDEEVTLARKYKRTHRRRYRDALVNHNLRFAVQQAHKYQSYAPGSFEDIVQEANIGLLIAAEKFDPERGYRFITYAVWWVRARIMIFATKNRSIVKMGGAPDERRLFSSIGAVFSKYKLQNPYLDSDGVLELCAEELHTTVDRAAKVLARVMAPDISLDAQLESRVSPSRAKQRETEGGPTHKDLIIDPRPLSDEDVATNQRASLVRRLIEQAGLSQRDRVIVEHRLMADDPATLSELGHQFNVSRERVRQIEQGLLNRLSRLAAGYLPDLGR